MTVQALSPYITQDHQALAKKRESDAKFHYILARVVAVAGCALMYVAISPLLYVGLSALKTVTFCKFLYTSAALLALALFASFQTMRETHAKSNANSHQEYANKFNAIKDWSPEQITTFLSEQGVKVEDYTDVERGALETQSPGAYLKALLPLMAECIVECEYKKKYIEEITPIKTNEPDETVVGWLREIHESGPGELISLAKKSSKTDQEKYCILFTLIMSTDEKMTRCLQLLQHPLAKSQVKEDLHINAQSVSALRQKLNI